MVYFSWHIVLAYVLTMSGIGSLSYTTAYQIRANALAKEAIFALQSWKWNSSTKKKTKPTEV